MGCAVAVANLHGVGEPLGDRELCVEVRALRQVGVGQLRHLLAVHLDGLVGEVDVLAGVQPREVLCGVAHVHLGPAGDLHDARLRRSHVQYEVLCAHVAVDHTRAELPHGSGGEHSTPVREQVGGHLTGCGGTLQLGVLAQTNLLRRVGGQIGFVNNVFGHHVQGRNVLGDDGRQGGAVCRNFAAAQLGELVHVVDGAGDVRVHEHVAARVGYGAGDGGYGEGQSGAQAGAERLQDEVFSFQAHAGVGAARGAHSPAATGGVGDDCRVEVVAVFADRFGADGVNPGHSGGDDGC